MKKTIKKIAAVIAAASVLGTTSLTVSAGTKEDVVAAARAAGFLEEYVQTLQNFLNVNKFTPEQYDILAEKFSSVGSEMDEIALRYFGKTVEEMKTGAQKDADENDKNFDDSFLKDIVDKMEDDDIVNILDEMVDAGKELGLDVSVEKKGDKDFLLTVKDKDGNVQLVTPVGKLVDRTGVAESENAGNTASAAAACAGVTAVGCAGAIALTAVLRKKED